MYIYLKQGLMGGNGSHVTHVNEGESREIWRCKHVKSDLLRERSAGQGFHERQVQRVLLFPVNCHDGAIISMKRQKQ